MTDSKLPKHRIIEKAKDFAAGKARAESKKLETLMNAIAADEEYWLWVNETLFENFTWASEAMAAKLNKGEIRSLQRHLARGDLHRVRFDDPKAYQAIISEALSSDILLMRKKLVDSLKNLEENTACVLKFTQDGAIASGYPHGIPFVCYFTSEGPVFVTYIERLGSHKAYKTAADLPLSSDHIVKRVARSIESHCDAFTEARKIKERLDSAEARLELQKKIGKTTLR
jgi:hypothetical protein